MDKNSETALDGFIAMVNESKRKPIDQGRKF